MASPITYEILEILLLVNIGTQRIQFYLMAKVWTVELKVLGSILVCNIMFKNEKPVFY